MKRRILIYWDCSDVELVQKALEQNDLPPKYREYLKLRIEESSPVDYREITIPKPSFVAVSRYDYCHRAIRSTNFDIRF